MKTPLMMNQLMELPPSFYHNAPEGYSYECEEYKKNLLRIWLLHPDVYSYTTDSVRTIWGFCKTKTTAKRGTTHTYHAPINSNKVGKEVCINDTTSFTSMQINYTGLEAFFI